MLARRMIATVGIGMALVLTSASPALAGTATAPGQGNAAGNCLNGPAHSSGSPSTGGGCTGHFKLSQP